MNVLIRILKKFNYLLLSCLLLAGCLSVGQKANMQQGEFLDKCNRYIVFFKKKYKEKDSSLYNKISNYENIINSTNGYCNFFQKNFWITEALRDNGLLNRDSVYFPIYNAQKRIEEWDGKILFSKKENEQFAKFLEFSSKVQPNSKILSFGDKGHQLGFDYYSLFHDETLGRPLSILNPALYEHLVISKKFEIGLSLSKEMLLERLKKIASPGVMIGLSSIKNSTNGHGIGIYINKKGEILFHDSNLENHNIKCKSLKEATDIYWQSSKVSIDNYNPIDNVLRETIIQAYKYKKFTQNTNTNTNSRALKLLGDIEKEIICYDEAKKIDFRIKFDEILNFLNNNTSLLFDKNNNIIENKIDYTFNKFIESYINHIGPKELSYLLTKIKEPLVKKFIAKIYFKNLYQFYNPQNNSFHLGFLNNSVVEFQKEFSFFDEKDAIEIMKEFNENVCCCLNLFDILPSYLRKEALDKIKAMTSLLYLNEILLLFRYLDKNSLSLINNNYVKKLIQKSKYSNEQNIQIFKNIFTLYHNFCLSSNSHINDKQFIQICDSMIERNNLFEDIYTISNILLKKKIKFIQKLENRIYEGREYSNFEKFCKKKIINNDLFEEDFINHSNFDLLLLMSCFPKKVLKKKFIITKGLSSKIFLENGKINVVFDKSREFYNNENRKNYTLDIKSLFKKLLKTNHRDKLAYILKELKSLALFDPFKHYKISNSKKYHNILLRQPKKEFFYSEELKNFVAIFGERALRKNSLYDYQRYLKTYIFDLLDGKTQSIVAKGANEKMEYINWKALKNAKYLNATHIIKLLRINRLQNSSNVISNIISKIRLNDDFYQSLTIEYEYFSKHRSKYNFFSIYSILKNNLGYEFHREYLEKMKTSYPDFKQSYQNFVLEERKKDAYKKFFEEIIKDRLLENLIINFERNDTIVSPWSTLFPIFEAFYNFGIKGIDIYIGPIYDRAKANVNKV